MIMARPDLWAGREAAGRHTKSGFERSIGQGLGHLQPRHGAVRAPLPRPECGDPVVGRSVHGRRIFPSSAGDERRHNYDLCLAPANTNFQRSVERQPKKCACMAMPFHVRRRHLAGRSYMLMSHKRASTLSRLALRLTIRAGGVGNGAGNISALTS